jgi:hypothetical protein
MVLPIYPKGTLSSVYRLQLSYHLSFIIALRRVGHLRTHAHVEGDYPIVTRPKSTGSVSQWPPRVRRFTARSGANFVVQLLTGGLPPMHVLVCISD